jgi:hypothetical protein
MPQTRFKALWIFVVSFLGLSTLLLFTGERLLLTSDHNGGRTFSISTEQVSAKGDIYLLGVGKADITGYVTPDYALL